MPARVRGGTLPTEPRAAATRNLPRTTEAERLVVQQIAPDIFRAALLEYWDSRCPLTGIRPATATPSVWDAAFDKGLVTFDDTGQILYSSRLSASGRHHLKPITDRLDGIAADQRRCLFWHRNMVFLVGATCGLGDAASDGADQSS